MNFWALCSSCSCLLLLAATTASAFAANSSQNHPVKTVLVTGANKGQGYALCDRILSEHDDTRVLLCSRNLERGRAAADALRGDLQQRGIATCIGDKSVDRIEVLQLDVTSDESVASAAKCVQDVLQSSPDDSKRLYGVVSNAGILWGYPLSELMDVCATGVRRVCDALLPMLQDDGRLIVVSSGLGPLMHGYSSEERQGAMMNPSCTWDETIQPMIDECLETYISSSQEDRPKAFEAIGFPGGPFAESAPDFHMYGLSKMFADAYMKALARSHPKLRINSGDPGLVYHRSNTQDATI